MNDFVAHDEMKKQDQTRTIRVGHITETNTIESFKY